MEKIKQRIKQIKNIIFDMDGTLINTAKATVKACQDVTEKYNLPFKKSDKIKNLIGWPNPEFYYKLYPNIDKKTLNKYSIEVELKEKELISKFGKRILYPGTDDLLSMLIGNNYYLTIASTGSKEHVDNSLKVADIYSLFEIIKCGNSDKNKMVKEIIGQGNECTWLIIGDREVDAKAGKANNIITIAAQYGFGTKKEYSKFDIKVKNINELSKLLGF